MKITVNDYSMIRRMFEVEHKSQRQIAKLLGISRNTVAKYCQGSSMPGLRASYKRLASVMTPEVLAFIEKCLTDDALEPNHKQHHTARRIYDCLVEEMGFTGSESTVRHMVHTLRGNLNEVFVPLVFDPGDVMQIDWGEVDSYIAEERTTLNMFCARLAYSCAPFVICFRKQNTEAFLEGLKQAFHFFGGVPRRVVFDNARVAVRKGSGKSAIPQEAYELFAAHYCFQPDFCNVRSGNEKGLVENLVGLARRNIFVPALHGTSLEDINRQAAARCLKYRKTHHVPGRKYTVAEMFAADQAELHSLPAMPYEVCRKAICQISASSTVRFETNNYSVPVKYAGRQATVKAYAETITVYVDGKNIASHIRSYGRHEDVLDLSHYLPLLERKPRSIFQAKPVRQNISRKLRDFLESHQFTPQELIAILKLCCEKGEDAFWQGEGYLQYLPYPRTRVTRADTTFQNLTVDSVNLSQYDQLLGGGESTCRTPV